MNCYIFCENGRVSRFNSGDLAGKLKPPIGFRKYALRAENNSSSHIMFGAGWIFCTKCDFLQVLDLHIFRQKQPGHWGQGCLPFSPYSEIYAFTFLISKYALQIQQIDQI